MAQATLGGIPFRTNPEQVRWNFRIKAARSRTIGGQVIQILGVTISDMVVSGRFGGGDPSKGDSAGWQEYDRMRNHIKGWVTDLQSDKGLSPIRFTYSDKGWDFGVYVKAFNPIQHDNANIAPPFQITLFIADGTNTIAKGIKDIYMARLMDGVGWKQTEYNGPTTDEVASILNGQSPAEYLASEAQAAFDSGLQGQFGTANN